MSQAREVARAMLGPESLPARDAATARPEVSAAPLLEVSDLRVAFEKDGFLVPAVDGLSYRLQPATTLAVIGESGSGKTVSCRALMGLLPRNARVSGSACLAGSPLLSLSEAEMRRRRGADIAMVFQDPARSLNPTMRIGLQITEAVRRHLPIDRHAAHARAIELLELLRVPNAAQRFHVYPHEMSGGMRQRVMIAIALAGRPRLLIADEATRSLDAITQIETLALLQDLQRQLGMALILISHDLRLAESLADEVLVMYAGRAVERAPADRVFQRPRMPYTRALLDATPSALRPPHSRIPTVSGNPPDLANLPPGCPFEPRCGSAQSACRQARPSLEQHEPRHAWACWHPCGEVT